MSGRRCTPQGKSAPNSFKTPTNATIVGIGARSSSKSVRDLSRTSNLDLTTVHNRTGTFPKMKPIVATSRPIDPELEGDLAYGEYLQSLMKHHLVNITVEKHKSELQDQLDIQDDAVFLMQMRHNDLQQELNHHDASDNANRCLADLEQFLDNYKQKCDQTQLDDVLQELKSALEGTCLKMHLKNITPISNQDQLMMHIEKCLAEINQLKRTRNLEDIEQLASNIKRLNERKLSVREKSKELGKIEKDTTHMVAKNASHFFAQKHL